MLSIDSSFWLEIGRRQLCYELEEVERSKGSGGLDHLVAGVAPVTMSAAERLGRPRWRPTRARG